ncbi:MAG: S41 family peptidase, partial [Myxococcota bacterium]
ARERITSICPTEKPEDWDEECRGTMEMTLFEAVSYMRGRRGTPITIYILREGMSEPKRFEITRDTVKVASVRARMLEPRYGYIKVSSFQERTGGDVRERLEELREAGGGVALSGLVLDLRDNPGGLLNQAVEVADQWLKDGLVVYTQGRDETQRIEYNATSRIVESDYPVVVLVNEGSASASEIVAGALQDHHRAIVLGVSTFGKGSVQTVYPLEGGAGLRLTTALYYTPSGRSIQEVGIRPDLEVRRGDAVSLGFPKRRRLRERDLEGHFTQREASGIEGGGDAPVRVLEDEPETSSEEAPEDPSAAPEHAAEAEEPEDVQLARALEVLKSWRYFEELRKLQQDSPSENPASQVAVISGEPEAQ